MAELYQVEFNASRREFFYNTYYHSLKLNEYVIIQAEQGEDMGRLTRRIETVVNFSGSSKPRSILRPAGDDDYTRYAKLREDEKKYKQEVTEIVGRHGLEMKIVDVECLFDGSKITIFFTADHRVDFRALVRELASRYRTRIELRQIGVRDEARRIGGYGICGRRQCCNGHICDFAPVSTQHAREQDLSLNPSKISGNCGRLLCCLRYEVDMYVCAKKKFPPVGTIIQTDKGTGRIERIDVFNEEAIFNNEDDVVCRVGSNQILSRREGDDRKKKAPEPDSISTEEQEELQRLEDQPGDTPPQQNEE